MKSAKIPAEMNEDLMFHGFFFLLVVVRKLMWEKDGTFAINYDDSKIFFVEASSLIFVEEL